MDGIVAVAVALATLWLAALTFLMVLVVRQIAIVSVRLKLIRGSTFNVDEDGPAVGSELSPEVSLLSPELLSGRVPVILLSATCMPCRDLVSKLDRRRIPSETVVLLAGREELASAIASMLPSDLRIIRDPVASELARIMGISSMPFGLLLQDGEVSGKAYLHTVSDLIELTQTPEHSSSAQIVRKEPANVG